MSDWQAVTLRIPTEHDLDVRYEVASELETWEERGPRAPTTLTRSQFNTRIERNDGPEVAQQVVFVVDVDGVAVGTAVLFGFDELARHAEAGISLVPSARGRGIGTEAMRQLVAFGLVRRNLHRIHLQAIASNVAALRSYEKAGFVVEGRLREHAWVRGGYDDIVVMAVLKSDFLPGDADKGT